MEKINAGSIQQHLEIKEIRDDAVILKNGGLRAVLMTTSVNFHLKSEKEQEAIVYRYQEFLNSLDFPIQIMIASRKFDVTPYLATLEQKKNQQENELLQIQTAEYIDFIKSLTESNNIMTESFYLVVPYSPSVLAKKGFFSSLFGNKGSTDTEQTGFEESKNNLLQRIEFVATNLRGFGLNAALLNTEELVELFYKLYNPGAKEKPELAKAAEMRNQ